MNRYEELQAFVAVIDYRGFGNAGDKLGIAKSMVSRRVSELEKRLGVQLLQRTTRRQSLTEAGAEFYRRATQLIADMNEAEQFVADAQCAISGRIKLTVPLSFGVSQLASPINRFLSENPEIEIEVDLNDRPLDLIEENVDLAIRVGDMEDSSLIVRGVSRPMTFVAEIFRQRGTEENDLTRLAILLTGALNRSDFGASGWNDLAGDQVRLRILARIHQVK